MSISLQKGQKIDLTKGNPGLSKVIVGLGCAFLLDKNGKASGIQDFIFYNNVVGGNGSVKHTGDNLTGDGDGDDEQINVDLANVPANIDKIAITVTIHEAVQRGQNFGQVSNAFVRIISEQSGQEVLRYDLGEDYSVETALNVCELYRHGGEWKFNAVGSGFSGGLSALCANFGLDAN